MKENTMNQAAKSLDKGDLLKAGLQLGVAVVGSLLTTIVQKKTANYIDKREAAKESVSETETVEDSVESEKDSDKK